MQNITYVTIGIGLIIFILAYILTDKFNGTKNFTHKELLIDWFIGSIIIAFLIRGCLSVVSSFSTTKTTYTYSNTYQLRSLKDNISINKNLSGAFVLCYGYINSNESESYKLKYISQDENGIYRINELENSKEQPYKIGFVTDDSNTLEIVTEHREWQYNNFFKWLYNKESSVVDTSEVNIDYIFHVSEDAIISDKDIDLE